MNYTDIFVPSKPVPRNLYRVIVVLAASWLIAVSAQISFRLPFSPVPVSGQTLAVLLTGLFLGRKFGVLAVGAYLFQGAIGLPFFAGGTSGAAVLLGPTGGYLFGFLAAAYTVGMLAELHHMRSPYRAAALLLLGNLIIYAFGLVWLARFVGEAQVLSMGLIPFLVGDLVKIILGVGIASGGSAVSDLIKMNRDLDQ
jgi:biotin transport system substrate-specific component